MRNNQIKISVIIPVLNEAKVIKNILLNLQNYSELEVIVVDGGSEDETFAIAESFGCKVLSSPRGRSIQMNAGAAIATGNILLFLHGDTILPANFPQMVLAATQKPGVVGGAFELAIDAKIRGIRLVEKMVNWRSHFFSLPYGDQAIFIKAEIFQKIGCFPIQPIMEDFVFIRKLKKIGKIAIISPPVITSGRRWQQLGIIKTTLINQLMILGYYLGVPPEKLASFYRKNRN
ncbi:TIGR04283 family arsenosugar biosynthesis glycosyltransferase [Phormidium sp. LEGE 05292]|uniref:TIGR04283 family arsenosugar biosynthesis glycosyltransferase n=1 Tax=[Phormidium] sp. LEGE 05292 TaxID=767427 RepID=UPI00187F9327|nr:TIGR04283 family arsenosugar biosynthesis glycosyltransferase [Phormidium sp. LEGE 05292]MBE9223990.1 TIGR04283 family arsenosugar biosynthesis glycosyltransferase [Phormidium sp. LEGE 05292]